MKIPYIKIPIADVSAYLAGFDYETKGKIFQAVLNYGLYQKWDMLELDETGSRGYANVQEIVENETKTYKKFCKEQKQKAKKLWCKKQNHDEAVAMPDTKTTKCQTETKTETEININNKTPLPPLKEFSNKPLGKVFIRWLDYRKQIKKPYKSQMSIAECYRKLEELSQGREDLAEKIVNQSIAQGWQGLFELKETNNVGTDYNRNPEAGKYAGFGRKIGG